MKRPCTISPANRKPEEIKLADIVSVLEGSLAPVQCLDNPEVCPRSGLCAPQDIWSDLNRAMLDTLESKTLLDLADRQKEKEQAAGAMYYI